MPCGCVGTCSCNIVGDGVTAEVTKSGDTFTVSAIPLVRSVSETSCIDLEVDIHGNLTAEANIADATTARSSVQLACSSTPGNFGLTGSVLIDPASTADVTVTTDGLRIDAPVIPSVGAVPTGTVIDFEGWRTPPDFIDAAGQEELVSSYEDLYDWLTLVTDAATTTSGSAIITGLPSTIGMAPGLLVQASGWGSAVAIATVDSNTQITLATNSSGTFAGTATVRAFKDGVATDGDSYFVVPDHRDVVTAGIGNMHDAGSTRDLAGSDLATSFTNLVFGAVFGTPDVALAVGELAAHGHTVTVTDPGHDHGVTDPGHTHSGTADSGGGHTHGAGSASERSYVTTDTLTPTTAAISVAGTDDVIIEIGLEATPRQTNNQETAPGGTHSHTLSVDSAAAGVTILSGATGITAAADDTGGGAPHNNVQPTRYVRKLIRT